MCFKWRGCEAPSKPVQIPKSDHYSMWHTNPSDARHYRAAGGSCERRGPPNNVSLRMQQIITARGSPVLADSRHCQRRCRCQILRVPRLVGVPEAAGSFRSVTRRCENNCMISLASQYDMVEATGRRWGRAWDIVQLLVVVAGVGVNFAGPRVVAARVAV
jgi:hypothetical protein